MSKYTTQQILEDPACEEIRNTVIELIKDYRYIDSVLYVKENLATNSLRQAQKCVNVIMKTMVEFEEPTF